MYKLGELIKRLRVMKGLTQEDLAGRTGIAKSSLCNYENGRRIPPDNIIRSIAEAMEVPEEEFADYMQGGDPAVVQRSRKVQGSRKRPIRVKKLLDAFYRLTDEAQAKAIEHVEDLARVPEYQRTIEDALQRYASSHDHVKYRIRQQFAPKLDIISELHIVLSHGTEFPDKKQRDCIYYWSEYKASELSNDEICVIVERLMYTGPDLEPDERLSSLILVFDDAVILDEFYVCFVEKAEEMDILFHEYLTPDIFLLVEKDTWEILEVHEYRNTDEQS